jgi:hypothetical protein
MTDIQESTPTKITEKKTKRKKGGSKKEIPSPLHKKTKGGCCKCTQGKCINAKSKGKQTCACRLAGRLCVCCVSPRCENKLGTDLDNKFTAAEKKKSYTPDGPIQAHQTKPTDKPSKSPSKNTVIQSFEQAEHYVRNVRVQVEFYRVQAESVLKQVEILNRDTASLREAQKKDREAVEKFRQEIIDLKDEVRKGRREIESLKRELATKTLTDEVLTVLGEGKNSDIQLEKRSRQ